MWVKWNVASSLGRVAAVLVVLICVWGVVFFVAVASQGVPMAWIASRFKLLSTVQGRLSVSVSPEVPTMLGEPITLIVSDSQTLEPVQGASVAVSKDGDHLYDLETDQKGTASFAYPGEATIIVISKLTYVTETKVIPRIPDSWVRGEENAWIASTATSIVSALAVAWIMRGKEV